MHWSEIVAQRVLERVRPGEVVVIGSGISLSGPVHVGHSREFLTAAFIDHAVRRNGGRTRFIAFADDMDPMRKVYPFLPPDYSRWVGLCIGYPILTVVMTATQATSCRNSLMDSRRLISRRK
jgi:lysyl-tRNA synthetase class 1